MKHSFNRPNRLSSTPPPGAGELFLLVVMFFVTGNLQSQEARHCLNFDLGSGVHNLKYDLPNGTVKNQYGYSASMGYTYFFDPQWGLATGVGVQSYGANPTLNYTSATPAVDEKGDAYEFRNNYTNWQEAQKALFVEVPLTVQFRHSLGANVGLLVSVGAKASIPVSSTYKTTNGEMVTSGYYSQWNAELYGLPKHGLDTYTSNYSGNLTLKTAYSGIADLGVLFRLSGKLNFYLGGYFNYGLNNITNPASSPVYQPNGIYNGIMASDQVKDVKPISFGIRMGLCWQMWKNR